MYARRGFPATSELKATTGISAASAFATGALNAVGSISVVAIPLVRRLVAALIASTMSETLLVSDPVHRYEQPSSLHASAAPFLAGMKNALVVAWLKNVNSVRLARPKTPAAPPAPLDARALAPPLPPQACSASATTPAAPPVNAARRVNWTRRLSVPLPSLRSFHSRRSTVS